MRTISRHLPPFQAERAKMPYLGLIILTAVLASLGYWIYVEPYKATIILGGFFACIVISMMIDSRRVNRLRHEREDTICEFRRSFDLRKVDPWIVRATHEAFGARIDAKHPQFPLRASDSLEQDLKIDPEDLNDIAHEVAQRTGYDISHFEENPLCEKIKTVEDFVLFFTYQPKIR